MSPVDLSKSLEKATGVPWEARYDLHERSKIAYYITPIMGRGSLVSFGDAFNALERISCEIDDLALKEDLRGLDLLGLRLSNEPNLHLASAVTIDGSMAESSVFQEWLGQNAETLTQAFDFVRKAPIYPEVATAAKHYYQGADLKQVTEEVIRATRPFIP